MVKLMAVIVVVLAISQTQALPTNGQGVKIDFSEDSNFAPSQVANRQKIEFSQDNEAQNLEEALFTYTKLLMNEKSGVQPLQEHLEDSGFADEQSTALCSEPHCDCSVVKVGSFQGTRTDNGDPCSLTAVKYCQGVCPGSHRYYGVEDGPGAEPKSYETYQCCLSTNTVKESISAYCLNSNGQIYNFIQKYDVPGGCACSSSSPCSRR